MSRGYQPGNKIDRQYGTLDEIRPDHLRRYIFAAEYLEKILPQGARVLDSACGCGYGSWLLHGAGFDVTGVDIAEEAISYAEKNYQGPKYVQKDCYQIEGSWDAVVTFETLEHLDRPEAFLANLQTPLLIASVPNENMMPFYAERFVDDKYPHIRHYTPDQFTVMLNRPVLERFCQRSKTPGDVEPGTDGLFLIYICE